MTHKINLDINTRVWTLSVKNDDGIYSKTNIPDHIVGNIINEYIKDMEESEHE